MQHVLFAVVLGGLVAQAQPAPAAPTTTPVVEQSPDLSFQFSGAESDILNSIQSQLPPGVTVRVNPFAGLYELREAAEVSKSPAPTDPFKMHGTDCVLHLDIVVHYAAKVGEAHGYPIIEERTQITEIQP
jgi:hypothetical protein